ncbi:MAG: hypothetical protein ACK5IQ_02760 [Bacteroidales bacterium]
MNKINGRFGLIAFLCMTFSMTTSLDLFAQSKDKNMNDEIIITGIAREDLWPMIERYFNEKGYPIKSFSLENQIMITEKFTWKSAVILNKANFIAIYRGNAFTLKIANREYYSDGSWHDAATKLGKGKKKEYLDAAVSRVNQIKEDPKLLASCKSSSYYYPTGPQNVNVDNIDVECIMLEKKQKSINAYLAINNVSDSVRTIKIDGVDHSIVCLDGKTITGKIDSVRFGHILKSKITNRSLVGEKVPANETRITCISFNAENMPSNINLIHTVKVRLMVDDQKKIEAKLFNIKLDRAI